MSNSDGSKPGNGSTSPFGNGQGATSAGTSKPKDRIAEPSDAATIEPGHDFTRDPTGTPSPGSPRPRDLTQGQAPPQRQAVPATVNPRSVPAGGRTPFTKAPQATSSGRPPFKGMK